MPIGKANGRSRTPEQSATNAVHENTRCSMSRKSLAAREPLSAPRRPTAAHGRAHDRRRYTDRVDRLSPSAPDAWSANSSKNTTSKNPEPKLRSEPVATEKRRLVELQSENHVHLGGCHSGRIRRREEELPRAPGNAVALLRLVTAPRRSLRLRPTGGELVALCGSRLCICIRGPHQTHHLCYVAKSPSRAVGQKAVQLSSREMLQKEALSFVSGFSTVCYVFLRWFPVPSSVPPIQPKPPRARIDTTCVVESKIIERISE